MKKWVMAERLRADDSAPGFQDARQFVVGLVEVEVVQHAADHDEIEELVRKLSAFGVHDHELEMRRELPVTGFGGGNADRGGRNVDTVGISARLGQPEGMLTIAAT